MGGPSPLLLRLSCGPVTPNFSDALPPTRFDKLSQSKSGPVLSWCPKLPCAFTDVTIPTIERMRGARPFEYAVHALLDSLSSGAPRYASGGHARRAASSRPSAPAS